MYYRYKTVCGLQCDPDRGKTCYTGIMKRSMRPEEEIYLLHGHDDALNMHIDSSHIKRDDS